MHVYDLTSRLEQSHSTNSACSAWNANYFVHLYVGCLKNAMFSANNNNMLNHEWAGGESGLLLNMGSAVLAHQTQRPGELIPAWSHWRCLFRQWMLTWKWLSWDAHSVSIDRMRQLGQCPARWESRYHISKFCALCVDTRDGGETCCSLCYIH